jgi:uncharacterized protein YjbI with pentapeptide repeats
LFRTIATEANFSNADLGGADLARGVFIGANFVGTTLEVWRWPDAEFLNAHLPQSEKP